MNFAITELGLYLDTHVDDQKALCLHRKYCKEYKELKDKYQKVYGPLNNSIIHVINGDGLEEPWPWERGNYLMWTYNKVLQYPINIKCADPRLAKVIIISIWWTRWRTCSIFKIFITKIWYARSKMQKLF